MLHQTLKHSKGIAQDKNVKVYKPVPEYNLLPRLVAKMSVKYFVVNFIKFTMVLRLFVCMK